MSEPLDIQLFYIQTLRYLMNSSISVLARSYSHLGGVRTNRNSASLRTNLEVFHEFLYPVLASSYSVRILLQTTASSWWCRRQATLRTNLEVFHNLFLPVLARSHRVILLVSEPLDIQLFYIQTVRYLMSSSIPVFARPYSVILLNHSTFNCSTYKP